MTKEEKEYIIKFLKALEGIKSMMLSLLKTSTPYIRAGAQIHFVKEIPELKVAPGDIGIVLNGISPGIVDIWHYDLDKILRGIDTGVLHCYG